MVFPLSTIKKVHAEIELVTWLRDLSWKVKIVVSLRENTSRKFLILLLFYLPVLWLQFPQRVPSDLEVGYEKSMTSTETFLSLFVSLISTNHETNKLINWLNTIAVRASNIILPILRRFPWWKPRKTVGVVYLPILGVREFLKWSKPLKHSKASMQTQNEDCFLYGAL